MFQVVQSARHSTLRPLRNFQSYLPLSLHAMRLPRAFVSFSPGNEPPLEPYDSSRDESYPFMALSDRAVGQGSGKRAYISWLDFVLPRQILGLVSRVDLALLFYSLVQNRPFGNCPRRTKWNAIPSPHESRVVVAMRKNLQNPPFPGKRVVNLGGGIWWYRRRRRSPAQDPICPLPVDLEPQRNRFTEHPLQCDFG